MSDLSCKYLVIIKTLSSGSYLPLSVGYKKGVRENVRECHNHKPQRFPDTNYRILEFLNVFFSETARAFFTRFHLEPSVERVLQICSKGFAPLNKMAAMPIYSKTLKNLLLQNQENLGAESWYIALRTQCLSNFF